MKKDKKRTLKEDLQERFVSDGDDLLFIKKEDIKPNKSKDKGTLIIFNLFGIQINPDSEYEYNTNDSESICRIIGEFWYFDLLIDGVLLVKESFINEFIKQYSLKLNVIKENCVYTKISNVDLDKLRKQRFEVEYLNIENFDPEDENEDDDEIYVFKLINNSNKKLKK